VADKVHRAAISRHSHIHELTVHPEPSENGAARHYSPLEDAVMIDRGWKFHPALKFALPFAAGIVLVRLAAPSPEQLLLLLYAGLCWLALAMRFERIGLAPSLVLIVM